MQVVPVAAGLFLLALKAEIAGRAGARVVFLLVVTGAAVVAGLGGAVVDVDLAETASELVITFDDYMFHVHGN